MRALAFSGGKDSMACLHLLHDTLDCAIYVDTGYSYPETRDLVDYAAKMVPMHVVHADRRGQNALEGIPADVVPVDWTRIGQAVSGAKAITIQSYLDCCLQNIALPLLMKAQALGVTELVYGQRNSETHRATARDGDVVCGITRMHPIEDWSETRVLMFLAERMDVPAHYAIKHSSLDCFDCTAYRKESSDRVEWMQTKHPQLYAAYRDRAALLDVALEAA